MQVNNPFVPLVDIANNLLRDLCFNRKTGYSPSSHSHSLPFLYTPLVQYTRVKTERNKGEMVYSDC